VLPGLSSAFPGLSPVLPGAPKVLSSAPRYSQTYHNHSHGTPGAVIRDPSYSGGRPECPPRVWYSPEIDASTFTLHILSDTPGVFQWLKYILLMDKAAFQCLDQFSCPAIQQYHHLCGSQHCWEAGGWKRYWAVLMALALGWCISTSDSYINCQYDYFFTLGMPQSLVCQTAACKSERFVAAGKLLVEMVVCIPVMLP